MPMRYIRLGLISIGLCVCLAHADPIRPPAWTPVEKKFLQASGRRPVYPHEYVAVIETKDQYAVGKLTALRFIEWVKDHPKGVVALTTGNTPEFFIKYLAYYKKHWHTPKVQAELKNYGLNLKKFPNTSDLKFVQIEDYFPISDKHQKKVSNYIQRHYCKILDLKPENVLLMNFTDKGILAEKGTQVLFMNGKVDLGILRVKPNSQLETWQQQAIQEVQAFCNEYEQKIRAWGGIDFFIGSISYLGNLGFNTPLTSLDSTTHIIKLDYATAAHCAKDLGGIEHARDKVAVTIGLGTITMKPGVIMILLATGESKAVPVRDLVEHQYDLRYPATILQKSPQSRVYINSGAAKLLSDRKTEDIKLASKAGWSNDLIEKVIIEIAQAESKPIAELTKTEIERHERGQWLLSGQSKPLDVLLQDVRNSLIAKIEAGIALSNSKGQKILHTGPHPDDIMLAYFPLMDNFIRRHNSHIAYMTNGFNSVSDAHMLAVLNRVSDARISSEQDAIFKKSYINVISRFRHYFVKQDVEQMNHLESIIALKHLAYIFDIKNPEQLKLTIRWLKDEYFPNKYPGDPDIPNICLLKGMMRESEVDRMWFLKNLPLQNVSHLRSSFYNSKEFAKSPRLNSDILPFINLYNDIQPSIITLADDPQSAPPKTHYYVLQIIADALRSKEARLNNGLEILGYRNIWFRYEIPEANIFVPVSEAMLQMQHQVFSSCFNTQRQSAFPSPFYDAEFSDIAMHVQREQLMDLRMLLGDEYFSNNHHAQLRNAAGFVFLKKMPVNEFLQNAISLQLGIELEDSFYS